MNFVPLIGLTGCVILFIAMCYIEPEDWWACSALGILTLALACCIWFIISFAHHS